jgi:hypothetical protein
MLRTLIAGVGAGALLTVGSLVAAAPAGADYQPWGSTSSRDHVLQRGCHDYFYRYRITVPSDIWMAETFLIGPKGRLVTSGAMMTFSDGKTGRERWQLCRSSVVSGRYKIRMKVTWRGDGYTNHVGWVKPSYFRLLRRR